MFVIGLKRTRRIEDETLIVERFRGDIRSLRVHVPPFLAATCQLI
ncbi:MAG: hypothetical protein RLT87_04055 [Gammaproteobacteria bacterium]